MTAAPTAAAVTTTATDLAAGAASHETADWHTIEWTSAHRIVRRLQARIVKATQEGRWGKVHALQHLLTHSYSGKVLAVRRVTENHGKNTPGVDQILWNTPDKKMQAVQTLRQRGYHPQMTRRVSIPKRTGKLRPLGILTMKDRAMQALYLLAVAPVAEVTGDPNSYGFRPNRSTADAIEQCFIGITLQRRGQEACRGHGKGRGARMRQPVRPQCACEETEAPQPNGAAGAASHEAPSARDAACWAIRLARLGIWQTPETRS